MFVLDNGILAFGEEINFEPKNGTVVRTLINGSPTNCNFGVIRNFSPELTAILC